MKIGKTNDKLFWMELIESDLTFHILIRLSFPTYSRTHHRFGHFYADKSLPRPTSSTRLSFRGHGKEAFRDVKIHWLSNALFCQRIDSLLLNIKSILWVTLFIKVNSASHESLRLLQIFKYHIFSELYKFVCNLRFSNPIHMK